MRVLVGTPCGGGQVSVQYMMSLLSTLGAAMRSGLQIQLYTLSQESLLPRGRNHIAQVAMRDKFDRLFFIDADSGWFPEQFLHVVSSPFPITAGCVPLKTYPLTLNYVPFKDDEKYFDNALRSPESTRRFRQAKGMAEVPVAFTGTAFLSIDVGVLQKLSESEATYQYPNPSTGELETHWDFFGGGPMHGQYYSEDWAFCEKARKAGFDIRVNLDVMINHVGTHVYQCHNNIPVDHAPEVYRPLLYRIAAAGPDELIDLTEAVKEVMGDKMVIPKVVHAPRAEIMDINKTLGVKEKVNDAPANPQ